MKIEKCRSYHARTFGQTILRMPDGKSVFKIYYISIIGRDTPEKFEWERCPNTQQEFERLFISAGHEGIGFVTAFPHITKLYRFSPYAETVLDVSEFQTVGMLPKDCSRQDGSHEFACYAESAISADEYVAWANAATVEEYLAFRCSKTDFPVKNNVKMAKYWNQG